MKLYRMYRHKKYGEPMESPSKVEPSTQLTEMDIENIKFNM
jgi:hypothetical protein